MSDANEGIFRPDAWCRQAGETTVGGLFAARARIDAGAVALIDGRRRLTFAALNERVNRLAAALAGEGIGRGDCVGILARNCAAWVELELAAAKLGAIVAAQNWRLAPPELLHCIRLAEPSAMLVGEDYAETLADLDLDVPLTITLGDDYETRLARADPGEPRAVAEPEDALVILYTSGTTGLPKGAVVSHRAFIARALVFATELGLGPGEAFVAWPPFFHMASTDHALASLLRGNPVIVVDGYDALALIEVVARERIGWLPLVPGMIESFAAALRAHEVAPHGIRAIGAMADLVPRHQLAEITTLLNAPYLNTFGATETGLPPATAAFIPIGAAPTDLAKRQSAFCEVRLVDPDDRDVPDGEPGECAIRGPTLFSGYWRAPEVNARDFRGGWFHMGDMFVRRDDGRLDFVDRAKYMIKSGGENVYPAEIERVLLADPRVDDAVVVRRPDPKWGEVPVAVIARNDERLTADELYAKCRRELAGYKQPKDIRFVAFADLPRSTTGKIQRHEVEAWLRRADKGSHL
ncbi:MAG TPA: AMP-binding protein [Geminicoccaceae bacterium]|nr:AMP-binding protein [Geminicoccaceae bacterium]